MINCVAEHYENDVFYDSIGMRLWEKRYLWLIDIGCAEGKLIQRLTRSEEYTQLVAMDIDDEVLEQAKFNLYPETLQDMVKNYREQQLEVSLYQGSILEKYPLIKEKQLEACTLIEIIEHLQLEDLDQLNEVVFGYYNFPYIFITTPNKDFNVYFKYKGEQMRHWDHKYEFTQNEFKQYCQNICEKYNYEVQYDGIGEHKHENTKNGYCSQAAIFKRKEVNQLRCYFK
ncbi:hypothetical protein PPERSA_10732 [Pseudocohnilembus persalinus]|uniref:Small RNA 2'-O-methyltransferase n=1 Tax=Pseudocohnilembus persalinus TaxID=266149 RepID=A0A0V0QDF6_PSEPJ|nr:hypothetical protein PPERSA_10732 [Pseudocohnilembus persalinus]|eukprot:KRX00233.1 hypothetical protein PPERSA_10732 [Pseudocohnilembus persalinus]